MAAIVIMEAICVAAVMFMICFLAVLFRESKPKSSCHVVYLSSRPTPSENGVLHLAGEPGARSERRATPHQTRFQVIVGGTNPPVRRVG